MSDANIVLAEVAKNLFIRPEDIVNVSNYTSDEQEEKEGKEFHVKITMPNGHWWKVGESLEDVLTRLDQIRGVTLIRTALPYKEVSDKDEESL